MGGLTKGLKQIAADFFHILGKDKAQRRSKRDGLTPLAELHSSRSRNNRQSVVAPSSGFSISHPHASLPQISATARDVPICRDALSDDGTRASSSSQHQQLGQQPASAAHQDLVSCEHRQQHDQRHDHPVSAPQPGGADSPRSTFGSSSTRPVPASAPTSRDGPTCIASGASVATESLWPADCASEVPAAAVRAAMPSVAAGAESNVGALQSLPVPVSVDLNDTAVVSPPRSAAKADSPACESKPTPSPASTSERSPAAVQEGKGGCRPIPKIGQLYISANLPTGMKRNTANWSANDFDIVRKIHKGYSSNVYMACCLYSGSDVVLKAYNLAGLSTFLKNQVLRELDIHSRLRHPGVVHLMAAFREGDNLVMVQEYVRGGSLDRVRRKLGGRMTEFQAMHLVLLPLLGVLTYLHERGIVHRDIKPDNLLFSDNWKLKVCDFGVSVCLREERAVTRTGTKEYLAPEVDVCPQKRLPSDNKDNLELSYSTAVDIWSLGALMYELLVGFTPFPGGPPARKEGSRGSAGAALAFPSSVSPSARAFVRSCLELDPADRPTVRQLLEHAWVREALIAAEALIAPK